MSTTLTTIQDLIVEKYGVDRAELLPNRPLSEFGLDSLSQVELLFTVEETFDITISDDRAQVGNLAELTALVDELLEAVALA
ncbi:phosphopantetheine-binding protein [Chitinimonas sp. BJB300]|uniref:phosphopantetheine-binding protein n=1 Tax=Chitinimonas sp. BJB300 TaxID=1559339 RepID=UPI000C121E2B|nr:phosphopantetheine-binding protein [Chitinimonas sp. BJB300]PHV12924.1 acyl carrier protein [Chitinimonas sp. BJB300]TSJ88493.1 acyl carrier protein [Chitinimonas sp. BJB300]